MSGETIHASCVAIRGRGVLIAGASGRGKSDLALRLIDRGAVLVADDYTQLRRRDGRLWASAPPRLPAGIEVRGVGIVAMASAGETPVALIVDLDTAPARLPETAVRRIAGTDVAVAALAALEASAPLKVELLLAGVAP